MIVTSCGNSVNLAKNIAKKLKLKFSKITISEFPDGDIYLKYNTKLKGKTIIIVNSLQPNSDESLFKIIFASETAKQLGAKKVILVAPYLAYMRQDKMFNYGECISSKVMSKLLNNSLDKIITIDPHLHRYKSMKDIFKISAKSLTANDVISDFIRKKINDPVIIGPDWESYQWAEIIAKSVGCDVTVFKKKRYSSRHVEEEMIKQVNLKGKDVVIVDDIISTGHTIIEAAKKARNLGAKSITAICVHGLFVENAVKKLKKAKINNIFSTNCIEHKTNSIDISSIIIKELNKTR
jgi:ribose-phosphate pyrophosphokinase